MSLVLTFQRFNEADRFAAVKTRLFLLCVLLLWSVQSSSVVNGSQTPEPKSSVDFLRESGFSSVRLERTVSHLVMKVKINGRSANLVVATNNPVSQIDRKLLQKFQLKEEPTGVPVYGGFGGSQQFGLATLNTLEISKAVLHEIPVAIVNLTFRPGVPRYDGVFALADNLRIGAIVDCEQQMLYFSPNGADRKTSDELRARLEREGFTRVPMHIKSRNLEVPTVINGYRSDMLVALESFRTVLTAQTAAKAGVDPTDLKGSATALGGRMAALNGALVKELSIGDFEIRNADVNFARSESNDLGIDQLEVNHAIIDIGGLALYLKH
jgi:hypothetical protein